MSGRLPELVDCRTLMGVTAEARLTAAEWAAMLRDPTKDKRYLGVQLGGDVAEFLSWGATEGGLSPSTLDQYERDLARGCVLHPDLDRHAWRKADIRLVLASYPPASRARVWSAHSTFWRWQYDEERIEANPMRGIRRPKAPPRHIPRVFTDGERGALVTAQQGSLLPQLEAARQLFLHDTGARKGEARAFRLEHADLTRRYVILHGKGNKERRVPIRGELVQALTDLMTFPLPKIDRPLGPSDYLFFPNGSTNKSAPRLTWLDPTRPMAESTFHRWWERCVGRAGVTYRKPHMTRHTYATDLLDASEGDIVAVREALGHESVRTTEFYIHVSQHRLEQAVERLAEVRDWTPAAED
jgi:site-specific recombinase XerD